MHLAMSLLAMTSSFWLQRAYLVQVVSLTGVRQEVCWLPALVYWLQQWQHALTDVVLQAVDQLKPLLAETVQNLQTHNMRREE